MPELPDLHVFSINLKKHLLDKPIVSASVYNGSTMNVLPDVFAARVASSAIADIVREGKELYFHLSNGNVFAVHLMLNGQFHLTSAEKASGIQSKIISVAFEDSSALSVSDFQGRCRVTLNPPKSNVPDALSDQFDYAYLANAARRNARKNVKDFLTDQHIVRGIGNAYVDEILYKANISPESTVGKIPDEALSDLFPAVGYVLRDAIDNILRIAPDSISGEVRSFLKVHNPRRSTTDDGEPIIVKDTPKKNTYFTRKQRLFI